MDQGVLHLVLVDLIHVLVQDPSLLILQDNTIHHSDIRQEHETQYEIIMHSSDLLQDIVILDDSEIHLSEVKQVISILLEILIRM